MGVDAETIEFDQPLGSFGLDSLMAMELRSSLESKLGVEIPVAGLLDDPTVTSLARVTGDLFQNINADAAPESDARHVEPADQKLEPRQKSALVAMGGAHGNETPLFCVHPVGGDLRCYDGLARALRSRPVFGLRARGLQAGSRPHQTIDEMVDDYVLNIRTAHPDGPYCLMGWSTGGIFAYEIARRLRQDGIPVQSLVLVDSPMPAVFEKVDLGDNAKFLVDLVEFANYFAGTSMEICYETLRQQSEEEAISNVLHLAVEHGVLPAKTKHEYLQRLVDVCKRHVEILQAYQPPPSEMSVQLLRPEDTGMLSEATGQSHDDDLGWGSLVQLQMHQVPGHHFTMMTSPNVSTLADKIDQLLRRAAISSIDETGTAVANPASEKL
jgi:myxalamid-type polyketide synthase MxaB